MQGVLLTSWSLTPSETREAARVHVAGLVGEASLTVTTLARRLGYAFADALAREGASRDEVRRLGSIVADRLTAPVDGIMMLS